MPTLSIVTAVHASGGKYLPETIDGVVRQELPAGWDLEWLIQEDGEQPRTASLFDAVADARYEASGQQYGQAVTRNLALSRVTGELVRNLDHDDVLLPGALSALIARFDDPSIVWAVAQADDLLPDGSRRAFESALPYGVVPPGVANDWAIEHGGMWPVHTSGLMMRTQELRAVGGWGATPSSDDLSMFAAISERGAGYNDPAVTWLYRMHDGQLSRQEAWWSNDGRSKPIAIQRVHAIRHGNGSPPLHRRAVSVLPPGGEQKRPSGWWRD